MDSARLGWTRTHPLTGIRPGGVRLRCLHYSELVGCRPSRCRRTSVAARRAGVGERADRWPEAPRVGVRAERELEHAEARRVAHLAVRLDAGNVRRLWPPVPTTNWRSPRASSRPVRVLRREALVVVVVPDENEVGPGVVERLPERAVGAVAAVQARGVARVMPVRERAARGSPPGRPAATPPAPTPRRSLRPRRSSSSGRRRASHRGRSCGSPAPGRRRRRRSTGSSPSHPRSGTRGCPEPARDLLHAAPRRVVRLEKTSRRAVLVLNVAEGEHAVVARRGGGPRSPAAGTSALALARRRTRALRIAGDVARRGDRRPDRRAGLPRSAARGDRARATRRRRARPPRTSAAASDDYSKRHGSPAANDLRIRRATTMRCTSSGPS